MQQTAVDLVNNRLADLGGTVPRVGDENTRTPVQPAIAIFVVNGNIVGAVPNQWGLAAHGLRLELAQFLEGRQRVRMRQRCCDPTKFGFNSRNFARGDAEFLTHNRNYRAPSLTATTFVEKVTNTKHSGICESQIACLVQT